MKLLHYCCEIVEVRMTRAGADCWAGVANWVTWKKLKKSPEVSIISDVGRWVRLASFNGSFCLLWLRPWYHCWAFGGRQVERRLERRMSYLDYQMCRGLRATHIRHKCTVYQVANSCWRLLHLLQMYLDTPPIGGRGYDDHHRRCRCSRPPPPPPPHHHHHHPVIIQSSCHQLNLLQRDVPMLRIRYRQHAKLWAHWTEACKAGGSVHSHQQVNNSCPFGGHDVHFGSATAAAWPKFLPGMLWGWHWNSTCVCMPRNPKCSCMLPFCSIWKDFTGMRYV